MFCLKHALLAVLCLFVFNFSAYALPLSVRQKNGSQTLETVTTEMTPDGPVTATCTIVLTPVTDRNGQEAVQQVKTCILVLDPVTNPDPSQPTTSTSDRSPTSSAIPTTTASAEPLGGSGAISANPVSTVTVSSSLAPTTSSPSNVAGSTQTVSTVMPNTSVSVTPPTSTRSSPGTFTPTDTENASDASSTTPTTSGVASGTTVAADSSNAALILPGKKLSVLPIGLGVFAGISVIALIVVGLVTYERSKYRKAFRQRKLAESGASMGYGGMARQ